MELNAFSFNDKFQKQLSLFVVFVTAIFFSSFFYSKQLYKVAFYVLVIIGFIIAIKRAADLLKAGFQYPWKYFLISIAVCVVWLLMLIFSASETTDFSKSGAFYVLYLMLFLLLLFFEESQERLLYFSFVLVFVTALVSAAFNGMTLSSFEDMGSKFSKYLLIASLIPLYRHIGIKVSQVVMVIVVASIMLGVMALIDYWQVDSIKLWLFGELKNWGGRVAGNSTPARFGTVGACLLCVCVAFLFTRSERTFLYRAILVVAAGFSLFSVLLAQSRGPWIAVLIFLLIMLFIFPNFTKRTKLSAFFSIAIAVIMIFQLGFVKDRIQKAVKSYDSYMQAQDYAAVEKKTAVGLRLELWRASYEMFLKSPVFGVGGGNFKYELKEIVEMGHYHPNTLLYHSSHNQFMAALSGRGILGFMATLLLFTVCFAYFFKQISNTKLPGMQSCAFGGLAVVVIYAVSGLSHETLDQKYLLLFFMVSISMFYSTIEARKNNLLHKNIYNDVN